MCKACRLCTRVLDLEFSGLTGRAATRAGEGMGKAMFGWWAEVVR